MNRRGAPASAPDPGGRRPPISLRVGRMLSIKQVPTESQNLAVGNNAQPPRRAGGERQRTEGPAGVTQLAGDSAAPGPEIHGFR